MRGLWRLDEDKVSLTDPQFPSWGINVFVFLGPREESPSITAAAAEEEEVEQEEEEEELQFLLQVI